MIIKLHYVHQTQHLLSEFAANVNKRSEDLLQFVFTNCDTDCGYSASSHLKYHMQYHLLLVQQEHLSESFELSRGSEPEFDFVDKI